MRGQARFSLAPEAVRYLEKAYECYVGYNGLACLNACRHCWAGEMVQQPYVPVEDLEPAMRVCREWLDAAGLGRMGLLFAVLKNGGLYRDWPQYHRLLMKYCDLPSGYARVVTLPGLPRLAGRELRAFCEQAKSTGIEWVSATLHGAHDVHDAFVGRPGDYAYYADALRIAREAGLQTNVLYYISRRNIACIPTVREDFRDRVTRTRGLPLIAFRVMQPFGLARQELASFLRKEDIEEIPAAVFYNWLLDLDTEANFVARVLEGEEILPVNDIALFPDHDFMLRPTPEKFGALVEGFLQEKFSRPPLPELAARYGDPTSSLVLNPRGFLHLLEMRRSAGRSA
ncbi:MAG: radical SAM protein [Candidatus Methylomirabilales bacterium]